MLKVSAYFLDQSLAITRPSTSVARQFTTLRLSFRLTTQFERFLKSWVMTKRSSGPWVKELNENLWADELYGEENGATGGRRSSCCSTVTSDWRNCRHLRPNRLRATPELTQLQAWHSNRQPQQSTGCAVTRRRRCSWRHQTLLHNWRLLLEEMPHRAAVIATVWSRGATLSF